ncbi:MAG TPA: MarR family winged helix-turn-helix transcriptional regulator [Patescibacteria group bacterium]|nr:MarR family winged helix-turn-helix transcriptional regulator [Patescibacteria group bacterium]
MIDDDVYEIWPADPIPTRDARVVGAVYGAARALTRRLELSTREHGLDAAEALVLDSLLHEPGCPSWLVRRRTGLHRSTLSSILDRLEADGRVRRQRGSVDGRRFEIDLTRTGRLSAEIANFIVRDIEAEIAGYTSPTQRHAAVAVFEACVAIGQRDRGVKD